MGSNKYPIRSDLSALYEGYHTTSWCSAKNNWKVTLTSPSPSLSYISPFAPYLTYICYIQPCAFIDILKFLNRAVITTKNTANAHTKNYSHLYIHIGTAISVPFQDRNNHKPSSSNQSLLPTIRFTWLWQS